MLKEFHISPKFSNFAPSSSVARPYKVRVPCAQGRNAVAPHLQKLQSLKWKIGTKAQIKQSKTFTIVIFVLFRKQLNEFSARNAHDKLVTVDGSNNAGSGGGAIFIHVLV